MTDLEYIAEILPEEDILCQISEEADELAKAALKLRRAITQTNPTLVTVDEAADNIIEEYGDTVVAMTAYFMKHGDFKFGRELYEPTYPSGQASAR